MAQREIKVVINGEEHVSDAAKKAEEGLTVFGKRIPLVIDAAKLLEMGMNALRAAFSFIKDAVVDSIRAYDDYAASTQRLSAQSKLTGVGVDTLKDAAKKAREEFGLGVGVANDAAVTTAKYASRAGDATKQNELLAAALNLGAASGLTAAESMQALELGLRGQDEGFDKLLGKNPSTIWKEYADANGLAVGKMTDAQKRLAEVNAVIDAGNKVGNVHNERLKAGAGQQELMNNKLENAKIAFGAVIQPIRIVAIQGLGVLIDIIGPLLTGLGKVANVVGVVVAGAFVGMYSAVGTVIEAVGKLTGSRSLEEWGAAASARFGAYIAQVTGASDATKAGAETHRAAAVIMITANRDTAQSTKAELDKQEKDWDKYLASVQRTHDMLQKATTDYKTILKTMAPAVREAVNTQALDAANTAWGVVNAAANRALDDMKTKAGPLPEIVGSVTESANALAGELQGTITNTMGIADAMGVLDDKTRTALSSIERITGALKEGMNGKGAVGALGGAVGLFAASMGFILQLDAPRRAMEAENNRMLEANNRALDRLRDEMNAQSVNVSGSDMEAATRAMSILASMPGGVTNMNGDNGGRIDFNAMMSALSQAGISGTKLDNIAKELGIAIRDKDGRYTSGGIQSLWTALQTFKPGTIGQNFGDQMQFFKDTQRVGGATGTAGGLQGFVDFLKNVGGTSLFGTQGMDLSTAEGRASLRDSLLGLMTQQNNGGFGAGMMGRLTSAELRQVILDMIGMIDGIKPPAGADSGMGGGGGGGGGDTTTTTGGVTVPSWTATLITAIETQGSRSSAILTTHTALQSRIADATESTVAVLMEVRDILRDSDASARDMDAALEESRRQANLYRGVLPVLA